MCSGELNVINEPTHTHLTLPRIVMLNLFTSVKMLCSEYTHLYREHKSHLLWNNLVVLLLLLLSECADRFCIYGVCDFCALVKHSSLHNCINGIAIDLFYVLQKLYKQVILQVC